MSIALVMPPSPFAYNRRVLNIIFRVGLVWSLTPSPPLPPLPFLHLISDLDLHRKKKKSHPWTSNPFSDTQLLFIDALGQARWPCTCLPGVVYFSTCGSACGRFLGPTLDSGNQISRGGVRNPHLSSDVFTQEESQQQLKAALIKHFLYTISLNLHRNPWTE